MPNQTYRSDPIVAIRVALNPVVLKADGTEELLGEIAAKLLDIPGDLAYLQRVSVQAAGLWKSGEGVTWKGPTFDMVRGEGMFGVEWDPE